MREPFTNDDLLGFAEDVAAGRRSLDNVIDQIAVAVADDRKRRRAVAELEALVMGLTNVRTHAQVTASHRAAAGTSPATDLVVERRRVAQKPRGFGGARTFAAGAAAMAGIVVVAIALASLRPGPGVGGPSLPPGSVIGSPGGSIGASGSPVVPGTSPVPPATPVPQPTSVPSRVHARLVFWTHTEHGVTVWLWDASSGRGLERLFDLDTYDFPADTNYHPTVLPSPDGTRFAIYEHGYGDPASHDRTRVFDQTGRKLWESTSTVPPPADMAWSADSTKLALGAIPSILTIVTFRSDDTVTDHTTRISTGAAYRVLAFSSDGARLLLYETSGEAEFWRKPAALMLSSGAISALTSFPPGLAANTTSPWVNAIDPETGDVLTFGDPTGAEWLLVRDGVPSKIPGLPSTQLMWAGGATVASLADGRLGRESLTVRGVPISPGTTVADVDHVATLAGVRSGIAVVLTKPISAATGPIDRGYEDVLLVALDTGDAVALARPQSGAVPYDGLGFGGRISSPAESPLPSPTDGVPSPTAASPISPSGSPVTSARPSSASPSASAGPSGGPSPSAAVPGPTTAYWSLVDLARDRLAIGLPPEGSNLQVRGLAGRRGAPVAPLWLKSRRSPRAPFRIT